MATLHVNIDRATVRTSTNNDKIPVNHLEQYTQHNPDENAATVHLLEKEHGTKSIVQFGEMATLDIVSHLTADDGRTMASSSDGKSSIGVKSTASLATFAMDEKESLRPDDSASIVAAEAAEHEHELQEHDTHPVESSNASNEDVRAFREQLNEISAIDPLRRSTAVGINQDGAPAQGVLYVPANSHVPLPGLMHQVPGELYETMPDVKLLEALENPRDRIWVLKLEQDVIDFVKDATEPSLVLPQCNSFYRMLAHKIADYYMLGHSVDDSNSAVRLFKTSACRIPRPLTGVITPSTAASTPPPNLQMTILRRGMDAAGPAIANGSGMPSKSTSEAGESCSESDSRHLSLQEREARYEAARLRILGSARPEDNIETTKEESRPGSTTGKKVKKGRRDNSDDDFEARSAYNSFFAQPPSQGSYQGYGGNAAQPQFSQPYGPVSGYPQYAPSAQGQYWQDGAASWTPSPAATFDLAHEFDRSMTFQQASPAYSASQSPFGQPSFQSAGPYQYSYQQNPAQGNGHFSPAAPFSPYGERPASSANHPHQSAYAYGQLPSQALGRPPNALEHPLPGSYKSRHFNPQSQTFIPTLANRPFLPQRTMSGPSVASPIALERQMSTQSQSSHLNSPGAVQPGVMSSRIPPQSLTHPLPQPVFPSQAPPAVSLPAKPSASQRMSIDTERFAKGANPLQLSESTIAKWGTPASLPAKPPTSVGKVDPDKTPQRAAQAVYNLPSFGSMPAGGAV